MNNKQVWSKRWLNLKLLENYPFKLVFILALSCLVSIQVFAQKVAVTGTVLDNTNQTAPMITVQEKGAQNKVVTDANGNFKISVNSAKAILVFTSVYFETQELSLSGKTIVRVTLREKINDLNEVVVIGYGEVQRKDLTGSVSSVKMSDLSKAPVVSFDAALGGRVAGVQVVSPDGQPGSTANIIIRGQSSITQDNSPLYVIDGFPVENPDNNALNPEEIESIQILKDASSAAIYGSRGASGVILITTKKGKLGAPVLNYDFSSGIQNVINRVETMNAYEFVKYQLEADAVQATGVYLSGGRTLESYRDAQTINWEDLMYRTAPMQNHSLSIRGGTKDTKYSISGSITSSDGVIINSGIDRYQGRLSLDQAVNKDLKVGANINYTYSKSYGTPTAVGSANSLMYNIWSRRPTNGTDDLSSLMEGGVDLPADFRWNPVLSAENELRDRINNNLSANTYLQYTLAKGLVFKATGIYQKNVLEYDVFNNSLTRSGSPIIPGNNGINGAITFTDLSYLTNENTLTYNKSINRKHNINVVGGYTIQVNKSRIYGGGAIQVPNESLGLSGLDEGTPYSITSVRSSNRLQSYLGRVNYNYKSKYYLTASFRADGSSKFRQGGNRWGYFPSAAVSWAISREDFFKEIKVISDAKLRLSYGTIGNNRVSDFAYLSSLGLPIINGYNFNNSEIPSKGIIPSGIGNPDLKWETSKELNLGLDVSLFKGRISLTTEVYRKRTDGLLLRAQLPPSFGYSTAFRNIGSVENKGLEFTLISQNVNTKDFKWESNFNISFNRNKVLALTDNQSEYLTTVGFDTRYSGAAPYVTQIGQPIGMFYGYNWLGNYQYEDFNETSPGVYTLKTGVPSMAASNLVRPGHIKYQDRDGNSVVNDNDRTIIGNPNPKYAGGFSNNFTYKNFDLNVFLQFSYGNDIINANRLLLEGLIGTVGLNMYNSFVDRWSPENQNNQYFATGLAGPRVYSTRIVEDGSYLRLKTISLGYKLPHDLIKKVKISNLRVYASAQNLITWTNYSGSDPEVSTFGTPIIQGFDFSAYPRPRTIVFGLNVTL